MIMYRYVLCFFHVLFIDLLRSLQLAHWSLSYGVTPSQNIHLTALSSIDDLNGSYSIFILALGHTTPQWQERRVYSVQWRASSANKRKRVRSLPSSACHSVLTFSLSFLDTRKCSSWCHCRRNCSVTAGVFGVILPQKGSSSLSSESVSWDPSGFTKDS